MPPRLILVGHVAGAFGVKGEVRIAAYTAEPLALVRYRRLLREDGSLAFTVEGGRLHRAGEIVVRVNPATTKEEADALRGLRLFVARDALPPTDDEDDFYLADLIGLEARDSEGAALGRIKAVHDFGAGDVLEVQPGDGSASWLVAFTRSTAPRVDLEAGTVVIVRPAEVEGDDLT